MEIAKSLDKEIISLDNPNNKPPHVRFDVASKNVIMRYPNDKEKEINAVELRKACKCASCIDEFTDKPLLNKDKVDNEVYPHKIEAKGNYSVYIAWSDGH